MTQSPDAQQTRQKSPRCCEFFKDSIGIDWVPVLAVSSLVMVVASSPSLELPELHTVLETEGLLSVKPDIEVGSSLWCQQVSYVLCQLLAVHVVWPILERGRWSHHIPIYVTTSSQA